jgi:hypothetical protein
MYIYIHLYDLIYMMCEIQYGSDQYGRSRSTSRWKNINFASAIQTSTKSYEQQIERFIDHDAGNESFNQSSSLEHKCSVHLYAYKLQNIDSLNNLTSKLFKHDRIERREEFFLYIYVLEILLQIRS